MAIAADPVETFRAEAHDLFEQLEITLLDIEVDPTNKELIDTAFRALHTIKGSGASIETLRNIADPVALRSAITAR